jgi:hypothetical protein
MATQKTKPYTITWPFTPKTAEDIDQTFDVIFRQVQLNAPGAGVLAVSGGGTGLGSFTTGDLLYAQTASTIAGLHDIATGNVLLSGGVNTAPAYGKVGLTTHVSGVLAEGNGGTNQSTYTQGDLIYASAANTLAKLAKDTNASRYLSNTGASNAPAWAQVNLANGVTGTLPTANGGTAQSSVVRGDLLVGNSTPIWSRLAIGAASRALTSNGTDPSWTQIGDAIISDVTEAKITDGTILARVAATETISAAWTFTAQPLISGTQPQLAFTETDGGSDQTRWDISINAAVWRLRLIDDAGVSINNAVTVSRVGNAAAGTTVSGTLTATTFSGSGASLTSIPESAITDGTILARVAANEVITGNWAFGSNAVVGQPTVNTPTGSNAGITFQVNSVGNGQLVWGTDAFIDSPGTLTFRTVAGATRATLTSAGALQVSGSLTPAADNTLDCGTAALRWALVRGVTITPGDLLLENGWVITESNKYGIATGGIVILDQNDDLMIYIEDGGKVYADVRPLASLPAFTKTTIEQRTGHPRPTP